MIAKQCAGCKYQTKSMFGHRVRTCHLVENRCSLVKKCVYAREGRGATDNKSRYYTSQEPYIIITNETIVPTPEGNTV